MDIKNKNIVLLGIVLVIVIGIIVANKITSQKSNTDDSLQTNNITPSSAEAIEPTTSPQKKVVLTALVNDKKWEAGTAYQGALYYSKGVSSFDKSGKPYFQLAFTANNLPDTRQLTISIKDFNPKLGKYTGMMEALYTGSETGKESESNMSGYKDGTPSQTTDFTIEITKWEKKSENTAIMSATFSGKLKGVLGGKDVVFKDGNIQDLEVQVFTEKY